MRRYKRLTEVRRKFGTGSVDDDKYFKNGVLYYPKDMIGTDVLELAVKQFIEGKTVPLLPFNKSRKLLNKMKDVAFTTYNEVLPQITHNNPVGLLVYKSDYHSEIRFVVFWRKGKAVKFENGGEIDSYDGLIKIV